MRGEDIDELRQRYLERFRVHGATPKALGWDKGLQDVRFGAAFEGLRPGEYASVLDIGCGFGDLLTYLRGQGWAGQYVGTDLVPEFIDEARAQHAGDGSAVFRVTDGTQAIDGTFDLVIALGIFNHLLSQNDNADYFSKMLQSMWDASRGVVVCDFLSATSDVDRRRADLYYMNPSEALGLGLRFSRRAALNHSYMPFEAQLTVWRDDSFEQNRPAFRRG